ncbi:MAG: hypothetical protein ACRDTP_03820, partial [Mycobacteriales bacterium]
LVQYDTPDRILSQPADEFVARFVGADRSLKRLALSTLVDLRLDPAGRGRGTDTAETIPSTASLRDTLSIMMSNELRPLVVVDADGHRLGCVTIEMIKDALRAPESAVPASAVLADNEAVS